MATCLYLCRTLVLTPTYSGNYVTRTRYTSVLSFEGKNQIVVDTGWSTDHLEEDLGAQAL